MGTRRQWSLAVPGALTLRAGPTRLTWEVTLLEPDYWLKVSPGLRGWECMWGTLVKDLQA